MEKDQASVDSPVNPCHPARLGGVFPGLNLDWMGRLWTLDATGSLQMRRKASWTIYLIELIQNLRPLLSHELFTHPIFPEAKIADSSNRKSCLMSALGLRSEPQGLL
jgi:hypothetical protein